MTLVAKLSQHWNTLSSDRGNAVHLSQAYAHLLRQPRSSGGYSRGFAFTQSVFHYHTIAWLHLDRRVSGQSPTEGVDDGSVPKPSSRRSASCSGCIPSIATLSVASCNASARSHSRRLRCHHRRRTLFGNASLKGSSTSSAPSEASDISCTASMVTQAVSSEVSSLARSFTLAVLCIRGTLSQRPDLQPLHHINLQLCVEGFWPQDGHTTTSWKHPHCQP